MSASANIVVVGQSGQGTILVSKILITALHRAGAQVAATEYPAITHRYAITSAHIRAGASVVSPRIRPGEADAVLGLEPLETLRASLLFAHAGTIVVTNDAFIRVDGNVNPLLRDPIAVDTVEDVVRALASRGVRRVVPIPASRIALGANNSRASANMILLGALFASGHAPVAQDLLEDVIVELAPRDSGVRNRDGFRAGIAAYRSAPEVAH